MGTKIDQTAEKIKTEASKTYTTYKYVDDSASKAESNANNYADTVGAGAKSYTDEQLKKYVTTTEMTTAISQTAEQIKTEAEKTYTSFRYVDETAGNLADEAEANAKSYADETAAAAADQALADAKADTDGKLKNYVTQVNMKTSIDQSAESVKTYNYDTKNTNTDDLGAEDKKYYRVQAGAYRRKEGADLMAEKIRKTGHKDVFVRMINGLYKVQAGAYTDRKNAEKTEKKLKAAGISCFIVCA